MIDTNQCKMAYDGVEEEYEDFYDYSPALPEGTLVRELHPVWSWWCGSYDVVMEWACGGVGGLQCCDGVEGSQGVLWCGG